MNKREQQRQKKEQKQQAAQKSQQNKKLISKIIFLGVLPLLLLATLVTLITQGPTYSTVEIVESDHIRGISTTPVPMVVYADFQCPACAQEARTITQIWPQIRGKTHFVFRHFPITAAHRHAWTASLYAEAAAKQDSFWEMHDMLFANQAVWSALPNAEDEFDSYALALNLDVDQLKLDMETEEVIEKVRSDQRGGNAAGVLSTPSVFIGGKMVANPTRDRIIDAIDRAYDDARDGQSAEPAAT